MTNEQQVIEHILNGFWVFYTTQHPTSITHSDFEVDWAVTLSENESSLLSSNVSSLEIKNAIFSLKPYKAPSVDGLHAGFFQHFWPTLEQSVTEEIRTIFASGVMPAYLNQTLVVLIPKRAGLELLRHFRSISLCTTIYKAVTKIIVNRIRPFMHQLVSPFQTAFIPSWKGRDNMIIAQEILHSMGRKKGRTGVMALKIDLEKAFDRLEWSFIREVLIHFNFPSNLIALIMECISTSSVAILFNGGKLEPFLPLRGIHQGDPISSYIFILCLEYLGLLIHEKITNKAWKEVKASRSGPAFTHLFSANDLILFGQASVSTASAIDDMLNHFCQLFGQKVSNDKSLILFSKNTPPAIRDSICNNLGFLETTKFDKYLGFPLKFSDQGSKDFDFIIQRTQEKLVGWQANLLSLAGRRILIQASSTTIADYVMQGALLPSRVCQELDRAHRNFLWGSTPEKRKMHMVNWDKVTFPTDHGGLGIHASRPRNLSLLAKLNWEITNDDHSPWVRVLRAKYLSNYAINNPWASKGACSRTWAACKAAKPLLDKGLRKAIHTGNSTSFWNDTWCSTSSVRSIFFGPLNVHEENKMVCDFIDSNGCWNWESPSFTPPPHNPLLILFKPSPSISPPFSVTQLHGLSQGMTIST